MEAVLPTSWIRRISVASLNVGMRRLTLPPLPQIVATRSIVGVALRPLNLTEQADFSHQRSEAGRAWRRGHRIDAAQPKRAARALSRVNDLRRPAPRRSRSARPSRGRAAPELPPPPRNVANGRA